MAKEYKNSRTADKIRSTLNSGVKTYHEYDAEGRVSNFYEAPLTVRDDDPCLVTRFKYVGTTHRILATKEEVVPWVAAIYDFDNL